MQLTDCTCHTAARVERLGGDRAFRRRLMELGLLPGTPLTVVGRAPFGGPLELLFRGCSLSIRREDASAVDVTEAAPGLRPLTPVNDARPSLSSLADLLWRRLISGTWTRGRASG